MKSQEYYLLIENLKKFQYRAQEVSSLEDLNLLISEFKTYIFGCSFLYGIYEKQVNSFRKYRDEHMAELEFLSNAIVKFVNSYHVVSKKLEDGTGIIDFENCKNIPKLYYFPNLRYVMGKKSKNVDSDYDITDVTPEDGIKNFYVRNISKYICSKKSLDICEKNNEINRIEQFITKNISEIVLKTVDFYALDSENNYMLGDDFITNDKLFKLWLQSALLQVTKVLIMHTKDKVKKLLAENDINESSQAKNKNKIPLNEICIKILSLRKSLEPNTFKEIAKHMDGKVSENSVKQYSMLIRNELGARTIDAALAEFEKRYYEL